MVICENLNWYYGFDVIWNEAERTLAVNDKYYNLYAYHTEQTAEYRDIAQNIKNLPEEYFTRAVPPYVYETDIVATFNGKPITAYNLNGQTAVAVEDLGRYGYTVVWDEANRTLKLSEGVLENISAETDLGTVFLDGKVAEDDARSTAVTKMELTTTDGTFDLTSLTAAEYIYTAMLPLAETFDLLNIAYTFEDNTLTIDTGDAKPFSLQPTGEAGGAGENKELYCLYVDKILVNGTGREMQLDYTAGHMMNTYDAAMEQKPYIYQEKIYIPMNFIYEILK